MAKKNKRRMVVMNKVRIRTVANGAAKRKGEFVIISRCYIWIKPRSKVKPVVATSIIV